MTGTLIFLRNQREYQSLSKDVVTFDWWKDVSELRY
jgi:hypothetical protein